MTPASRLKFLCRPLWDQTVSRDPIGRLWRRDYTLWKPEPEEISNRLGWLDLPFCMRADAAEVNAFAGQVRQEGINSVVLLGMGGSSLSAEVLRIALGENPGQPRMHVLDSTVPERVERVTRSIDPARTLFLVSSKSGGTIEVMSLYRHFRKLTEAAVGAGAGSHFVAITDPGTSLEQLALDEKFRRAFINPPDLGGRYSVLSYFGLLPAALMGLDVVQLLSRAGEMARSCGVEVPAEDNAGAWLGLVMGCMAVLGRNKLTIITSPKLAGFGLWAEQLVAESTGKEGKGILPVAGEPFNAPGVYGEDRLFTYLRLATDDCTESDRHARELHEAGQPVMSIELRDMYDLGADFFRWEFAVAVAGVCLEINAFDQPNVEESKRNSRRILEEVQKGGALPKLADVGDPVELIHSAQPGGYVALMAFAEQTPESDAAFNSLRNAILTRRKLPSTLGYGPRFLHSTGQFHKGGPEGGLFIQFTADYRKGEPIPGASYDFATLATGQAIGDFEALQANGRRVVRVHVGEPAQLPARIRAIESRLEQKR